VKDPKIDRSTAALVGAVGAYIGLNLFAAGVEWERERARKARRPLEEAAGSIFEMIPTPPAAGE